MSYTLIYNQETFKIISLCAFVDCEFSASILDFNRCPHRFFVLMSDIFYTNRPLFNRLVASCSEADRALLLNSSAWRGTLDLTNSLRAYRIWRRIVVECGGYLKLWESLPEEVRYGYRLLNININEHLDLVDIGVITEWNKNLLACLGDGSGCKKIVNMSFGMDTFSIGKSNAHVFNVLDWMLSCSCWVSFSQTLTEDELSAISFNVGSDISETNSKLIEAVFEKFIAQFSDYILLLIELDLDLNNPCLIDFSLKEAYPTFKNE